MGGAVILGVHVVNAFTDDGQGGNPAGVVLDADWMNAAQKQEIAHRVRLSETAFVSASDKATVRLEFFTPTRQIAYCGHATIAAFSLLRHRGRLADGMWTSEMVDGVNNIVITHDRVFMEQCAPMMGAPFQDDRILKIIQGSLGASPGDLTENEYPVIVSTGNPFLLVPMRDQAALQKVQPDHEKMHSISSAFGVVGSYVFTRNTELAGRDAATRMFAPAYGIEEEAATGMAAGALAAYLCQHDGGGKETFMVEQGRLMKPASPSLLEVSIEIQERPIVRVGGSARVMETRTLVL